MNLRVAGWHNFANEPGIGIGVLDSLFVDASYGYEASFSIPG